MISFRSGYAFLLILVFLQTIVQSLPFAVFPAVAHDLNCHALEEFFGFTLKNYAVEHQGDVVVDIDVVYRLIASPEINHGNYPDFLPILQDIQAFMVAYPNEADYWEILNRNLGEYLLERHPQLAALDISITVLLQEPNPFKPISHENYERFSRVTVTRPDFVPVINLCPGTVAG